MSKAAVIETVANNVLSLSLSLSECVCVCVWPAGILQYSSDRVVSQRQVLCGWHYQLPLCSASLT